jgi:hypothetical protein
MRIELACEIVNSHATVAHTRRAATIVAEIGLGRGATRVNGCCTAAQADQR